MTTVCVILLLQRLNKTPITAKHATHVSTLL